MLKFWNQKFYSKNTPYSFWKSLLLTLDMILGYIEAKFYYGYWTNLQDCILEQEEKEEEKEYVGEEEH